MNEPFLNIAAIEPASFVDGPGKRMTIWVQGCPIKCPGCINADFIPEKENQIISIYDLAMKIIEDESIEGISFSGGEPFTQAKSLVNLCEIIKAHRPDLSFFSYSGFYLSELIEKNDYWTNRLLEFLDILVAGPFLLAEKGDFKWRGSGNKKIHYLSNRYQSNNKEDQNSSQNIRTQIVLDSEGEGSVHGFGLTGNYMKKLKKVLNEKGIEFNFKK